jgi:RNA polymerase sigma-70 factor, ECF subfamily
MIATEEKVGGRVTAEQRGDERDEVWTEAAFESAFLQHYGRVVAVLLRLVGDRAQAEELAGDVFWKAYRQPLPPGEAHNLGGWLYRVATRLGIDALRAGTRRRRYEQEAGAAGAETDEPSSEADPLSDVLREEKRRRVREALARMKPAQAQLLILRQSGLSYQELARALGVKPGSVGTLLARAEGEFERRYRELHGAEEDL